jgi:hypothetical protein
MPSHLARHAFSYGTLHETAEAWQHVDGRVHLPVVELAVNVDLQTETSPEAVAVAVARGGKGGGS